MTRRAGAALLVVAVALAGCSIRSQDDDAADTLPVVVVLTFEDRDLDEGLVAPVPIAWTAPDPAFPRFFRPPPGSGLDREVTLWWVDAACAGECRPRSEAGWKAAVAAAEFAQFDDPGAFTAIRRAEAGTGFELVEAENNFGVVALTVARWADGGSAYLACRAAVPARHDHLIVDFEAACRTVPLPG